MASPLEWEDQDGGLTGLLVTLAIFILGMLAGCVCKCMLKACLACRRINRCALEEAHQVDAAPVAGGPGVGTMRPAPGTQGLRRRSTTAGADGEGALLCGPPPPTVRMVRTVAVQSQVRYTWWTTQPRFQPWDGAPNSSGFFEVARGPHVAGSW